MISKSKHAYFKFVCETNVNNCNDQLRKRFLVSIAVPAVYL